MKRRRYLIPVIILSLSCFGVSAHSEVVVLKTGKKLNVEKVWCEKGQIWILLHGMRASISPGKVARIEGESNIVTGAAGLEKEKSPRIEKSKPRSMPPKPSHRQTTYASQATSPSQTAGIKRDQRQILPDQTFRNLKWGTKISAIKGLEKIQNTEGPDGVVEYQRKKEDLTFGRAKLSSIHYTFWRDKLYMLTIRTQGHSNYTALRDDIFRMFGKGLHADQAFERYLWTEAPNDMMLQYSKDGEQGLLWLRSSEIDRQYKLSQISSHASYLKWMKSRN